MLSWKRLERGWTTGHLTNKHLARTDVSYSSATLNPELDAETELTTFSPVARLTNRLSAYSPFRVARKRGGRMD